MSTKRITPLQRDLLEFLSFFRYLTTQRIWEEVGAPRSKRATEQMLARLRQAGLITAWPLHPEQGRASAYAWRILPKGAAVLGVPYHRPAPPPATATPNQLMVLQLLGRMKQLTTTQIWQHLHAAKARSYTSHLLARLRARNLIASAALYPERGRASEHYWRLCPPGCVILNLPYDNRYTRRPHREALTHRAAHLTIERQVAAAGWALLEPAVYNAGQPRPAETPQAQQLIAAVLAVEGARLATLLAQGTSPDRLHDRLVAWQRGLVGAVVPQFVNEYVAYQPDQPQHTALLILHPWQAGPGFWTRRVRPAKARSYRFEGNARQPRVERYQRLAGVLPVVAVFVTREVAYAYARILEKGGLRCTAIADLAAKWDQLTTLPLPH